MRVHEDGALLLEELADPTPDSGEVLVRLRAIGVNRRDLFVRHPPSEAYRFQTPFTPGLDGAGTRCDTGEEVLVYPAVGWGEDESAAGPAWQLLGGAIDGTYAEFIRVPATSCFAKPERLSWQQAGSLPVAGLTAYRALFTVGGLRAGSSVLILGAGSGVSTIAVMLAVQVGADVYLTSSSGEKLARAYDLGAVGGANYRNDNWPEAILELTDGKGVDLVFDSVGTTWGEAVRCLGHGGAIVALGGTGGQVAEVDVRSLYLAWRSIKGTTLGSPRDFARFLEMVVAGSWEPVIDSVWPLEDAEKAHLRLAGGEHFGKLILEP